jgi:uncharacterized protein (TIGR02145 family)
MKKLNLQFIISFFLVLTLPMISCKKEENDNNDTSIVKDIDGNIYNQITIGTQIWLVENLKTTKYRNGDIIPTGLGHNNNSGAYENYEGISSNADTYGRLYNWYAVVDSRGLCPTGWHIPSDEEWKTLEIYLGMSPEEADKTEGQRGTDEGGKLKQVGTSHWESPNTGATNESGFTALPGGVYDVDQFYGKGQYGVWWTSTPSDNNFAWYRYMHYNKPIINRSDETIKQNGLSVRCIKD